MQGLLNSGTNLPNLTFLSEQFESAIMMANGNNDLRDATDARRQRANSQSIRNINHIMIENQNGLNTVGINEVTREIIQMLVEIQ